MKDLAEVTAHTARYIASDPVSLRAEALPLLTIVYHPDVSRIGQFALLASLTMGKEIALGRSILDFHDVTGGRKIPLNDLHISRKPLLIGKQGDSYTVVAPASGSPVAINGKIVNGSLMYLSRESLLRGVIIELASRVVLLWQIAQPPAAGKQGLRSEILGQSALIDEVRHAIEQVATIDLDVLILGESGTGKELVAQAIHRASSRAGKDMVSVSMPAIPATLCASELFGSAHGAFTGSRGDKAGYFAQASGSTLFLDEIGDVPLEVQSLLLRALETREIHPVGGVPLRLDLRVISATDADLDAGVRDHSFKTALRHRLSGYDIRLPALRERRMDIAILAAHFLQENFTSFGESQRLSCDASSAESAGQWAQLFSLLVAYDWPGNVRELRNMMCQLAVLNRDKAGVLISGDIEQALRDDTWDPGSAGAGCTADNIPGGRAPIPTEEEVRDALRRSWWEIADAARLLGVKRQTIYRAIARSDCLRTAADVSIDELLSSHDEHKGCPDNMCLALEVSRSGLRRRLRDLRPK